MESSQCTSGCFVHFFLESIACLLSAPSQTNKQLASPNNQFAPYASQHHLWFSKVQKLERRWAVDDSVKLESSRHATVSVIVFLTWRMFKAYNGLRTKRPTNIVTRARQRSETLPWDTLHRFVICLHLWTRYSC